MLNLLVGVDNLDEVLLETGAAHQGAVNVGASGQGLAVVSSVTEPPYRMRVDPATFAFNKMH